MSIDTYTTGKPTLPTAVASREKMQKDVPAAKSYLNRLGITDLNEVIFGEDA